MSSHDPSTDPLLAEVRHLRDRVAELERGPQPPPAPHSRLSSIVLEIAGWFGALASAVTAYIRVLGGTFGLVQSFRGPMAKQHRMAVMTLGCLIGIGEYHWNGGNQVEIAAAGIIAFGAALTCFTRTRDIATQLKARP